MKRFLIKIGLIVFLTIAFMFLLDVIYTKTYLNRFSRNKTQYILSLNENDSIDYVFLGSSRVENSIVTSEVEKLTNKTAVNLGTQGAKLDDIYIYLQLLINSEIKIEKIFIQLDYIYNFESNSSIVRSQVLPYIRNNEVINNYLKKRDSDYFYNYYIPFYRYMKNDYRIGFREFIASSINKKAKLNFTDGYSPLYQVMNSNKKMKSLPITIKESNKSFNEIDSLCKKNNVKVVYFSSPYCKNEQNRFFFDSLKGKVPELKDFSRIIYDNDCFQNCSHLNHKGALLFTRELVKQLDL